MTSFLVSLIHLPMDYMNIYLIFAALPGWGHSVRIDGSSIEWVEEFKYLGTMLTNQNSIQEEIKSRLKSGNACYYSV